MSQEEDNEATAAAVNVKRERSDDGEEGNSDVIEPPTKVPKQEEIPPAQAETEPEPAPVKEEAPDSAEAVLPAHAEEDAPAIGVSAKNEEETPADEAGKDTSNNSDNPKEESQPEEPTPLEQSPAPAIPDGLPPQMSSGGQADPVSAINTNPESSGYSAPPLAAVDQDPNATIEERGEVTALYVGRVIGKGGEVIRDLMARSGCRIDVDQNVPAGQPRVITYRGMRRSVEFAKQLVQMLCTENASIDDLPLGEAVREFLLVPAQSVGKIIGRGGETIRLLQARSQAKVQIDHSGTGGPGQVEKQVTITGTGESVIKVKEMIQFLVANPLMEASKAITMLIEEKVNRGGQWGSGPPYINLPNMGQNMQPNSIGGGGYGGYDEPMPYYGNGSQGGPMPDMYGAPNPGYGMMPPQQQSYPPPQPMAPGFNQFGGGGGGGGRNETEMFYASKNYMGRIIGRKGVTINDLQARSGCDIQINQDVPPGQDCEISLQGSRQGIEAAKRMIREVMDIGPNHPYAGGNQGGGGGGGGYHQGGYGQPPMGMGYPQSGGYGQYQAPGGYDQQMGYQQPPPQQMPYMQQPAMGGYQAPPAYNSPPVMPVAPVSDWKTANSPDGQVYYYNEKTGETQWDKPVGMP